MKQYIINHFHIHGNYIVGSHINMYTPYHTTHPEPDQTIVEEIVPMDTSFFCTQHFSEDIIEKNLRQAIYLANSKADACRRIMALEPLGYLHLSNVTDERKAELINPFATPKYIFKGEDFRKARNG